MFIFLIIISTITNLVTWSLHDGHWKLVIAITIGEYVGVEKYEVWSYEDQNPPIDKIDQANPMVQ